MPISLALLYFFGGSVYLIMGGDLLVRGAVGLSRKLGIPEMVVGLTVVALGTSAPELVVSVRAALTGFPEVAIANVVGSNTANALLVVGLPALLWTLSSDQPGVERDGIAMMIASAAFVALCFVGPLDRVDGLLLLLGLGLFALYVLRSPTLKAAWSSQTGELPRILGLPSKPLMIATFLLLGIVWLPLGAELLLRGAVGVGERLGLSNAVIGLTMVALSTSLPELTTSLIAAFKREADVAVGNVLGSNVLNLLAIMGAAAVVSPTPIPIPPRFPSLDLPVMLLASLALTVVIARRHRISRPVGGLFLLGYLVYVVSIFRPSG